MKNVIVTGATSFIGVNLIKELIKKEYNIFAIVRPKSSKISLLPKSERINIIELEMNDYKSIHKHVNNKCDIYFSLAWNGTRGSDRDNMLMQEQNYNYSIEGLNSVLQLNCNTIISAGSQAEYGLYKIMVSEQTPEAPVTEYGRYKLKYYSDASEICESKKVNFKEPRFFSLYGPDDFVGTMIISTLKSMLKNQDCDFTLCQQMWDFLYIDDAIYALIDLIEKQCENGVYNFGSGISKPLKEYINTMYRLTCSASKLNFGAIKYPESGIVNVMPSIRKLKEQIDFIPKFSFEQGILKIIERIQSEDIK